MNGTALLLAAGRGERLGCGPKAFADLAGTTLLRRAADAAAAARLVDRIVVAVPDELRGQAERLLDGLARPWSVVAGGASRQASAAAALGAAGDAAAVAVHDAARAICPSRLFDDCLAALDSVDAAIVGIAAVDTVKQALDGVVSRTLDRAQLIYAQTPQAFRADVYRRAHAAAERDGVTATDDAALVERVGVAVHVLPGDEANLKITTPRDMTLAAAILDESR